LSVIFRYAEEMVADSTSGWDEMISASSFGLRFSEVA